MRAEEAYRWRDHVYVFDRSGDHTGLPGFMINIHRVDSPADMEAYVARVAAIGGLDVQLDAGGGGRGADAAVLL